MTIAGALRIDLSYCSGQVRAVQIASTRPEAVARVLIGKTPEQVLTTVPLLFTLCGNAQAYAALLTCRAALDRDVEPEVDAARELLVQLETLREHAWRILLDWPGLLGLEPDKKAVVALLKFDGLFKRHLFQDGEAFKLDSRLNIDSVCLVGLISELTALIDAAVFGGQMAGFQEIGCEAQLFVWLDQNTTLPAKLLSDLYQRHWQSVGRNNLDCLPELTNETLNRHLQQQDLAAFCRAPNWQGKCFETTPLNRQLSKPLIAELHKRYGNGLMVRFLAVLLEVAAILNRLPGRQGYEAKILATNADDIGLAQVQAARGLLIHRLVLRQGRVYDYHIIAPTEWNFHPEGVVAQGLKNLQADDTNTLQRQAQWLINAVDPCVQFDLKLTEQY